MEIRQSLWTLLNSDMKIEIPIIQRDYAQGRSNNKARKIREKFVGALVDVLSSSNSRLELDFVYGSIENKIFRPLDGQQRLTTLFLLHWFIANELKLEKEIKETLLKFTYETRISSREFMKSLVLSSCNLGEGETIAERIKDAKWFYSSWQMDPTIQGALNTLETIEKVLSKVESVEKIWNRLTSLESPAVSFNFRELENFGLSDDLYIKMNARGKELTDFEYFKARFEKLVHTNGWENGFAFHNTFSYKMDTQWTDFFWKFRGDDNQVDNEILNFLATISMINYSLSEEIEISNEDRDRIISKLNERKRKNNPTENEIKLQKIDERIAILANESFSVDIDDFLSSESFRFLSKIFDVYANCNLLELDLLDFQNFDLFKEKNLLEEIIKDEGVTYKQRVLFFAQTCYLLKNQEVDNVRFEEWMRLIRNICMNSTIDSALTFRAAIKLVNELSSQSNNIYKYMTEGSIVSNFAKDQVQEEIRKAKLICSSDNWKNQIFELEDTAFCQGDIAFVLDVAYNNEDYDISRFTRVKENVNRHFASEKLDNDIRRAFLTIEDYKFYNYWSSWSYNLNVSKKALLLNRNELKVKFTRGEWSKYLKGLLRTIESIDLSQYLLNYKKPEDMPNWKYRLIKEKNLIDNECTGFYFGIDEEKEVCYLFRGLKRPNSIEDCVRVD